MGIIGSKSKQKEENKRFVKSVGYQKLHESPTSSPESNSERPKEKNTKAVDINNPSMRNEIEDTSSSDALFIGQSQSERPAQALSLSLTTQVSPKCQVNTESDGHHSVHGTNSDTPVTVKPKQVKRRKEPVTKELAPLSGGKLGNKQEVRKQLEKQGLLKDANKEANEEGILGELKEFGLVEQNSATSDLAHFMSATCAEPRRRLPARLPHIPLAEKSLPTKLNNVKFGTKVENKVNPGDGNVEKSPLSPDTEKMELVKIIEDMHIEGKTIPDSGACASDDVEQAEISVSEQTTRDATSMKIKMLDLDIL